MRRLIAAALFLAACTHSKPAGQNPSPMVENTRVHERLTQTSVPGKRFDLAGVLSRNVDVLVTTAAESANTPDLIVHFHGAAWVAMQAADSLQRPVVVAAVNLGSGSGVYSRPFADGAAWDRLLAAIETATGKHFAHRYLTGFSAGYGAIRSILRSRYGTVDGVLLLDGIHTSYIPDGKPLASGGKLDETGLDVFRKFEDDAIAEKKRFVITHSEIFPGTFASTTECTDYLLKAAGLKRTPVVSWGPLGMQQLSEVHSGWFTVLGFAGNTAPDHIDHLHAMEHFIKVLIEPGYTRRAAAAPSS